MIRLNNKFAIGCLIQWYEIELIPLYLESVKQALDHIENKENVIIEESIIPTDDPLKGKQAGDIEIKRTGQVMYK